MAEVPADSQWRDQDPVRAMAAVTRIVLAENTLDAVLQRTVEVAKETIPGAAEVSVTMRNGRPVTPAFSGQLARDLDESQYEAGHGPCLSAIDRLSGRTMVIDDAGTETRWPDYTPRAVAAATLASLSVPLAVNSRPVGALNVYGREPHTFGDHERCIAEDLAAYAGIVLNNAWHYFAAAEKAEQMQQAKASRARIEQAKGILMGARRCADDEAFDILVRLSQQTHRKLHDIAEAIVAQAQAE